MPTPLTFKKMSNRNPKHLPPKHNDGTGGVDGVQLSGQSISTMDPFGLKRAVGDIIAHETVVATKDWAPMTKEEIKRMCAFSPALFQLVMFYWNQRYGINARGVALRAIYCANGAADRDTCKGTRTDKIKRAFREEVFTSYMPINIATQLGGIK